ncbi:hypothetical protein ACIF6L_13100 [Kitasatospora sp. NPDC086009]|uniref:hypothetical protein n=1 Tax=unclassified Kitasatospora TaxID=2633591 RepID=UPI0037C8F328
MAIGDRALLTVLGDEGLDLATLRLTSPATLRRLGELLGLVTAVRSTSEGAGTRPFPRAAVVEPCSGTPEGGPPVPTAGPVGVDAATGPAGTAAGSRPTLR